jgi:hypothetical protein
MRHSESPLPGFVLLLGALVQTVGIGAVRAEDLPVVNDVDLQPLAAQVLRVKEGRSYVGDGRSHLIDFRVGDREWARRAAS